MARALQNRLTHLLSNRRSSTPRLQVSQLHGSRISQRFWNLLNLEHSQRNNGGKSDAATEPDCSRSNPRMMLLKGSKPSVGELLSKWCCQFNDKFHHDRAPQLPYYRQRAPQLPRRPCSQAPFCPSAPCPPAPCPPKSDPCPKPEPRPAEPCNPCQNAQSNQSCQQSVSCSQTPRDPCKKPKPYPPKPCEQCPRKPSCPPPKPCPPPPPCPKPTCPDPCDPCRPRPTPMGCPVSMPTRCSLEDTQQMINLNSPNVAIPMASRINQSLLNRGRSQMRGFHGSIMRNMRCNNDNSSVKKRHNKRHGKKGKKSKTRSRKAVCSDSMPFGKIIAKSRGKCGNSKSKKGHTSGKPNKTKR